MIGACPVCGDVRSTKIEEVNIKDQHYKYVGTNHDVADQLTNILAKFVEKYELMRCDSCGLEYSTPLKAPDSRWYSALYSAIQLFPGTRWEFDFIKKLLKPTDIVVDYGCGSGLFLNSLEGRITASCGYDFSINAIDQARKIGVNAHLLPTDEQRINGQISTPLASTPTHIVSFHVLEHLENPSSLFAFASEIASHETTLWIAVPSDRRASRKYGPTDHLDQPPHHLTRWNRNALEQLGSRNGWKLMSFYYEPISIRTRIWELARRTDRYECIGQGNLPFRMLLKVWLALSILLSRYQELFALRGFSMMACYTRKEDIP